MFEWLRKKVVKIPDNSDLEMIELLENIKDNFKISNLSWDHSGASVKKWEYILNGGKIKFVYDTTYSSFTTITLRINNSAINTELISNELFNELMNFFKEKEKNEKVLKNTEIFNTIIASRIDATKYNL